MAGPTPRTAEPGAGQSTTPVCARARSVARALVRLSSARVEVAATTTPWSSSTRRAISSRTGSSGVPGQPLGVVDEDGEVGMGPTVCDEAVPVRVAVPGDAGDRVTHCAQRGRDGVQRRAPPRPRRPDDEDPPVATGDVEADALEVAVPNPDGQETADAVELTRSEVTVVGRRRTGRGHPAPRVGSPSDAACASAGHRVQRLATSASSCAGSPPLSRAIWTCRWVLASSARPGGWWVGTARGGIPATARSTGSPSARTSRWANSGTS